jgi:hypothetical protein
VAFSNTVPHRFDTICNDTNEPQKRLFINFFVVDPKRPLAQTTANNASPTQIYSILAKMNVINEDIVRTVLAFCGGYSSGSLLHRTIVRDQARSAMSSGGPHWATMHYGNAGYLEFYPDARNGDEARPLHYREHNYVHSASTSQLGSGL